MRKMQMKFDLYKNIENFAIDLKSTGFNYYSETLLDDIQYSNTATEILMKLNPLL